jgi:uncharacterized protein (DUF1499 family)
MSWQVTALIVGCVIAAWVVLMLLFRLLSRNPTNLDAHNGRLSPCPSSPNCVCTHDTDERHRIPPLTFTGSSTEAMTRLKAVLSSWPRVRIVAERDEYLHAEFRTLLFRFVDDVEFLIDGPAKVIHFRSASRAGRGDLGVNRRRMEAIRRQFTL